MPVLAAANPIKNAGLTQRLLTSFVKINWQYQIDCLVP
jgi:hypothetical protein